MAGEADVGIGVKLLDILVITRRFGQLRVHLPDSQHDIRCHVTVLLGIGAGVGNDDVAAFDEGHGFEGGGVSGHDRPRLYLDAAAVDQALAALGLRCGSYYVLAPGAEYGSAKRWPARHFAELARHLDLPVVLLGSGKEFGLCEEIAAPVNAEQDCAPCFERECPLGHTRCLADIAATEVLALCTQAGSGAD